MKEIDKIVEKLKLKTQIGGFVIYTNEEHKSVLSHLEGIKEREGKYTEQELKQAWQDGWLGKGQERSIADITNK